MRLLVVARLLCLLAFTCAVAHAQFPPGGVVGGVHGSAPLPKPTGPVRISGGVMRTLLVSEVAAIYPPEAKAAGVQGTIVVRAIIATDGTVQSATLAQGGPDSLAAAAIAAVRQYRYRPYLLNGEPHEVDTTVYVQFRLDVPETAQHH